MRRALVLALLAAALLPLRARAQAITAAPGGNMSSLVGMPFDVPFYLDMTARSEKLGSFAARIQWNPAVLHLVGGGEGTFGNVRVNEDSLASGVARIAGANPAGVGGMITLGILHFTPLVSQPDTIHLAVTELFAAGSFADLTPSLVVRDGYFCPARGMLGDVDKDGAINSRDALIALSNAVGLDVSAFDIGLGDVDANGATNARDALIILSSAVGLPVGANRVGALVGGSCSANLPFVMAIVPDTVELMVGQTVAFEARAKDSTGALQTVTNAIWKSGNTAALAVFPDGKALARDTGTVRVTAIRSALDSAQAVVRIVARRTLQIVDAVAENARNQLGSVAFPFATIAQGIGVAQDGDTLRIRLGRYEIQDGTLFLGRPVVLIGDTAADGSRPVLAPDSSQPSYDGDAIDISGPGRFEVQNLAFSGVYTGVYVGGADCVLLRGVRMTTTSDGVYLGMPTHCLRIEHSVLIGPGQILDAPVVRSPVQRSPVQGGARSLGYYYGGGVTADAPLDTLTIEDSEITGFYYGVNLVTTPDSTTIRRSSLHDFQEGAVVAGGGCHVECSAPSGQPAARRRAAHAPVVRSPMTVAGSQPPAVVIEWSRLARTSYGYLVDIETPVRRMAFAHNVMTSPGRTVVYINDGTYSPSGYLSMVGDSIVAPPENQHYYWLDAEYLDSLTIDSLQVVGAGNGYTYDVALVRMTNSTLRDIRYFGLEVGFGFSITGGVLQLDNDSVIGDPRDDAQVDAFEHYGARVEANRITVINAYEGIDAEPSDSSTTITNSVFRHVQYPIYWEMSSYPGPSASTLTVKHSTFDGFSWGIEAYDGRMVVDTNTFLNGDQPIYLDSKRPLAVRGNQIASSPHGIEMYSYDSTTTVTVVDNTLSGISSSGIHVDGYTYPDTLQTVFDVRGNAVTCAASGATGAVGIELYEAHMAVNDNQVSNCYEGIRTVVATNTPRSDSIVGNTVTAPASAHFGIGVAGSIVARIGRNTVTGAATGGQTAGLVDADGPCGWWACPDYGPSVVTIDSNVVSGGTNFGIRAQDSDSLVILGNTVQNLNSPTEGYNSYPQDVGGITVMGYLGRFASVVGNVVKHIAGSGIILDHYSYDGVVVQVDSNVVADLDTIPGSPYGGTGILQFSGGTLITRNLLTGARWDGVRILTSYDSVGVTGNNISGNLPYGVVVDCDCSSRDAFGNYWGDQKGPRGVFAPDSSLVGDFVSNVNWNPFRVAQNDSAPTTVPPGAPRFLARAGGARAVPMASSASRYAPFLPAGRFPVERAAAGAPRAATAGANDPSAARAERAAQRAQRLQELRARIEARDRARQAAKAAHAPPGGTRSQGVRP